MIGTGGSVACASGHVCDSVSGEIAITVGSSVSAAGTLVTVYFADARTNTPNCTASLYSTAGATPSNNNKAGVIETTTSVAIFDASVVNSSQPLTASYVCMGN